MGVRKNAKFLSATERESLVRAFVMMKADIVNPGAAPADQYSRWDEYVAIHRMIQSVNAPGGFTVNFGHGGSGAYGFLSWHRYFLHRLEQQLQSYVAGVWLPYWDWTDPSPALLVDDFLGPNGDPVVGATVTQGYFAADAPGTGANLFPAPAWWPAGLTGWRLHAAFGASWEGPLRRAINGVGALPAIASIRSALDKGDLPAFQHALESGSGVAPPHSLHNGLHGWWGGGGVSHMSNAGVSPFDPVFYLHHCNVDRLWAMWQMDGHATDYPASGGDPHHHLNDPMYPWVGGAGGYSTNLAPAPIVMPDFSALGAITPADVLDHRALGYTYDTLPVVGLTVDRTGSMNGLTPDPMLGAPDVTKWEAATRGVSAFLLDCETAYAAAEAYVWAGVKTFRRMVTNEFAPVFAGDSSGLVKAGGGYSSAAFDAAVAPLAPGGSTPLIDALLDADSTLVRAPFGDLPSNELRYLAILTDGKRTSGLQLTDVADGSLANTAVLAMGFGTGADVDYPTIEALRNKGVILPTQQVFHGESAGVIDKFYSQALAAAIGFTPLIDPLVELFEGEHTHVEFTGTTAEEALFITVQGMDFSNAWSYQLLAPDGSVVYTDASAAALGHAHGPVAHGGRLPSATVRRGQGRLSLIVQRDGADDAAWVGTWSLMIAWRARDLGAMVMLEPGELLYPVSAGPVRGARYGRLLTKPTKRIASRAAKSQPRHRLDVRPPSTNREQRGACAAIVNIYARTRLRVQLASRERDACVGGELAVDVTTDLLRGAISNVRGFGRAVSPVRDLKALVDKAKIKGIPRSARLDPSDGGAAIDAAVALARLESRNPQVTAVHDEELRVVSHHGGMPHVHGRRLDVVGAYHVGVWIEGRYDPQNRGGPATNGGHHQGATGGGERFVRVLATASAILPSRPKAPEPAVSSPKKAPAPRQSGKAARGKAKRKR